MSDSNTYKAEFEAIISNHSWWARLRGSQFVTMIATFVGQMVTNARSISERSLQEAHLSTATKRSSILAAAEDKGYIGRKIMPSTGMIECENLTDSAISIPRETPLISRAALEYVTVNAVEIPARGIVNIPISQLVLRIFKVKITAFDSFIEVILPQDVTAKTHKVDVYVAPPNGGAELWEKSYMFRKQGATDKAYAEFYKPTDQLGIRFGDGVNGKIPTLGSDVTLKVWTTEGDSTLIDGQALEITGASAPLNAAVAIKTITPIVGGAKAESDEETRAGALYLTPFDNQIAWDDDYAHFIRQNIANIIWVVAWGEKEQEKQHGSPSVDFINNIYVSAYSSVLSQDALSDVILDLLESTDYLNKRYKYVPAKDKPFQITITGTVTGDKDLVQVRKVVAEKISAVYGRVPVSNRPKAILEKNVNTLVDSLELFYDFSIDWGQFPENLLLEDYVFIDINIESINVKYVGDK